MNTKFVECDTCRAKPGTPTLCNGCINNRLTIMQAEEEYAKLQKTYEEIVEMNATILRGLNKFQIWAVRLEKLAYNLGFLEAGNDREEARLVKVELDAIRKKFQETLI